ncbi:MAG TPA: pyruvate dehydrogenase complex dihydrolipoamide acetyltransferase [Saprospiraceae bacterium]|nr:pyruvate dehydrogenase complex dihydrolipoamide acetyltransferase [Saprospiraceae bacterium]
MAEVIRMPRMSDTMEEGNIVSWLKNEGDSVEIGETLAEVETDKATMELDSPEEGVLLHIAVKEGAVPINGVIAVIGKKGEDWKAAIESSGSNGKAEEAKSEAAPAPAEEKSSPAPVAEPDHQPAPPSDDDKRVKASPLAKNLAKDAGIDIGQVEGSGDQGRIVKRDIEAAIEAQKSAPAPQPASKPAPAAKPAAQETPAVTPFAYAPGTANFEEKSISQMRKTIARRLGESKFTAPHFYLTIDINMDKSVAMRKQVNEVAPTKISFNDFVVKAAAVALRQHPGVNSSWLGDKIRYNKDINIGVAVAVDEGLLVPVIRYADIKTLSQINTEVKHFAGKAKERKLQPDEMQGNTFTISNLGMFGIEEFTAIINPPDSCILAVGAIIEKPVVKNGEIVIANMMKVTLSCDHRTVDGAMGAQFLQTFKGILEDPIRLMV